MDDKYVQVTSENANSGVPQTRQISVPNEQQSDKSDKQLQRITFLIPCGDQKNNNLMQRCSKLFFKIVLMAVARSTLFKPETGFFPCALTYYSVRTHHPQGDWDIMGLRNLEPRALLPHFFVGSVLFVSSTFLFVSVSYWKFIEKLRCFCFCCLTC